MITGDNPLTAVSVARECGLITQAAHVFAPTFVRGNAYTPMSRLQWTSMDEEGWILDDYSLKPLPPPEYSTLDSEYDEAYDYALVVTGDVFRWMINHAPLETVQRVSHHSSKLLDLFTHVHSDACTSSSLRADVTRREERDC